MDKNASLKADTPQTSPEASFTTFIQLDGRSAVPSQFRSPGALPSPGSSRRLGFLTESQSYHPSLLC
jgi:hypothetical protein